MGVAYTSFNSQNPLAKKKQETYLLHPPERTDALQSCPGYATKNDTGPRFDCRGVNGWKMGASNSNFGCKKTRGICCVICPMRVDFENMGMAERNVKVYYSLLLYLNISFYAKFVYFLSRTVKKDLLLHTIFVGIPPTVYYYCSYLIR